MTNDPKFIADALQMGVPPNLWEDRHFVEEAAKKHEFLILLASPQLVQDDAEFTEVNEAITDFSSRVCR